VVQCLDRHVPDIAEACAPVQAPVLLEASGPSSTASMAKLADSSCELTPPGSPSAAMLSILVSDDPRLRVGAPRESSVKDGLEMGSCPSLRDPQGLAR
jgi:hypothetical protein